MLLSLQGDIWIHCRSDHSIFVQVVDFVFYLYSSKSECNNSPVVLPWPGSWESSWRCSPQNLPTCSYQGNLGNDEIYVVHRFYPLSITNDKVAWIQWNRVSDDINSPCHALRCSTCASVIVRCSNKQPQPKQLLPLKQLPWQGGEGI